MKEGASSADDAIEEAVAEAATELPPRPDIKARVSTLHLVLGNLVLVVIAAGAPLGWLPWGLLVILVSATLLVLVVKDPHEAIAAQYIEARREEVTKLIPDQTLADTHLQKELKSTLGTVGIDAVAMPTLLLTLVIPITIFLDLSAYLIELHWFLRWSSAAVGAAAGWGGVLLLWGFANFVPGLFPTDVLVRFEAQAIELGREDENDIQIIRHQVHLDSLHKRIETYTLEGALLSALSFSSFISLIVSEMKYREQLLSLFESTMQWRQTQFGGMLGGRRAGAEYPDLWEFVSGHLIPLIGLSLLFCAATFLGVLVARLRFNEGYREAESCLKIAERFNEKEELAIEGNDTAKAAFYATAIANLLISAKEWERGLAIIVTQMRISRNAGIICFIFTLVLCGLFFRPIVAAVIAMLFAVVALLGYVDRFARQLLRRRIFSPAVLGPLSKAFRREGKG